MKSRLLLAGLAGLSVYAVAVTAYGIRTHDSAVRGWAAAANATKPPASAPTGPTMPDRAEWAALLGARPESDMQLAQEITTYLHRHIALGPDNVPGTLPERFRNAISGGGEEAYCGDYSVFLRAALETIGIPARTVQLATGKYTQGQDPNGTHVTTEALLNGRWHVVDATFNAALTCGSEQLIDISSARQCVLSSHAFSVRQLPGTLPGRSVAENPISYREYLANYMRADVSINGTKFKYEGAPDDKWLGRAAKLYQTIAVSD